MNSKFKYQKQILFTVISFMIISSCNNSQETVINEQNVTYLPALKYVNLTSEDKLTEIINNQNSRALFNSNLDFSQAVTAIYEEFENVEFVYVPSAISSNVFNVFIFNNGVFTNDVLQIENTESSMLIKNDAGSINVAINENLITNIDINYNQPINGRILTDCNYAQGFLDCANDVQDQASNLLGGAWGALAFDIACSSWVVCRGAFVVGCITYAIAQCKTKYN